MLTTQQTELIEYWKSILRYADRKKWVMFSNGTVIIFLDREDSLNSTLIQDATNIMREDGPVIAGTERGDFNVIVVSEPEEGFVTTSHNPNLLTISKASIDTHFDSSNDMVIGLQMRARRQLDSEELQPIASSVSNLI